jgi:hypothetical protein
LYERILYRMREMVRKRAFVMTLHAEEEMDADNLTIFDVERGILTGQILERQRDRLTTQPKYRIQGQTLSGSTLDVIAKISPTDKLIIITVYKV